MTAYNMDELAFFKEFLKNWRSVGSITPSSKFLVKKMLEDVEFKDAKLIIELGAGSGIVTREILKKMGRDSRLVVFETSLDFYQDLKKIRDSRVEIYNQSAVNLQKYLGDIPVDYIISGIPLANLSRTDKRNLLQSSYKALRPHGRFVQFQYSLESRDDLKKVFDKVTTDFTPLNIPPAFIFSCLKK